MIIELGNISIYTHTCVRERLNMELHFSLALVGAVINCLSPYQTIIADSRTRYPIPERYVSTLPRGNMESTSGLRRLGPADIAGSCHD